MHKSNPDVIRLAKLIGRTPSSVAMKLVNFASLDPAITSTGRRGLGNTSTGDKSIWCEFHDDWERLALESNQVLDGLLKGSGLSNSEQDDLDGDVIVSYEGATKAVMTQARIKQSFFRKAILSSYQNRCCISSLQEAGLLIASHIIPWSKDRSNRLNPRNGLCLSVLHDRAFDLGLITVTPDFRILVSGRLEARSDNSMINTAILRMRNKKIRLPEKFLPSEEFLDWHNRNRFKSD